MFRLGVITDEIAADLETAIEVMKEENFREAEIRGLWGKNIADLSIDEVKKAKLLLDNAGINVCAVSSPFFKCDEPGIKDGGAAGPAHGAMERGIGQQADLLRDLIAKAKIFNTDIIRTFSFWKKGELTEGILQKIIDAYKEPLGIAAGEGMVLALENEHSCYIGTGAEAGRVVREINHPNLKVVWDPGNAFCAGEKAPYPDGYKEVRGHMAHFHIKDPVRDKNTGNYSFTLIGEGEIDYKGQIGALAKDFSGVVSLETHYIPAEGQKEGTRACMKALKKMIENL